jgi:hypothetical protein
MVPRGALQNTAIEKVRQIVARSLDLLKQHEGLRSLTARGNEFLRGIVSRSEIKNP